MDQRRPTADIAGYPTAAQLGRRRVSPDGRPVVPGASVEGRRDHVHQPVARTIDGFRFEQLSVAWKIAGGQPMMRLQKESADNGR
jgi:hypothetical protein